MKNWTKKKPNPMLRSFEPTTGPFDGLTKEARIEAMKAAIKEVVDAKLNKGNN
jgi:hypothetical protein